MRKRQGEGRPGSVRRKMTRSFEHLPKEKDENVTVTINEAIKNGSGKRM